MKTNEEIQALNKQALLYSKDLEAIIQEMHRVIIGQENVIEKLILADEINRAPPKVQSALLEAMQERQVTISDESHPLEKPFLVMATQNPVETQGTYELPEAQVDRFMFKILLGYPTQRQEQEIMNMVAGVGLSKIGKIISPPKIIATKFKKAAPGGFQSCS